MKKRYIVVLLIVAVFIIGCKIYGMVVSKNYEIHMKDVSTYSEKINISIPKDSTVLEYDNTNYGFNGDGESYTIIKLTEQGKKEFIDSANKSDKWSFLPLSEEIQAIIFGGEYEDIDYGDGILKFNKKIPKNIKNGIYYFKDRYEQNNTKESENNITSRYSYNFTISILDIDDNNLYIFEYDS